MGHMNTTEDMPPIEERRGCAGIWPARTEKDGVEHETYNNDCPYCFLANGGKMD